jgi:hypothetical protein
MRASSRETLLQACGNDSAGWLILQMKVHGISSNVLANEINDH